MCLAGVRFCVNSSRTTVADQRRNRPEADFTASMPRLTGDGRIPYIKR